MSEYNMEDVKIIEYWGSLSEKYGPSKREVCPFCYTHHKHLQSDNLKEANVTDCKNIFLRDGKVVGQCCCWMVDHPCHP